MSQSQPPTHIWTTAQTIDLVEFINKQSILARSFLNPNSDEAALKLSYQQKLCLQLLQRTEWMEWMRREGWVILGEKGLRPTDKWGRENPVAERLEWLQLKHITLCTRLHNHQSVATMGKNSAERRIWEEYKKKGGYEWYFTYHRLWLSNSPAAAHLQGAAPHPLAEAALSSTSLRHRVGAGAVLAAPANGNAGKGEEEEGDIVYVEARPVSGGAAAPPVAKVEAKPTLASRIGTPAQPPSAAATGLGKRASSGSISTTSTKVESSPGGPAPAPRPAAGAVRPPPVIPAKRSRSPPATSKVEETKPLRAPAPIPVPTATARPAAPIPATSVAGPSRPAVLSPSSTPPPPVPKRARKSISEGEPVSAPVRRSEVKAKAVRGEVIVIDDSDEDDDVGGDERQATPPTPEQFAEKPIPAAGSSTSAKPPSPGATSSSAMKEVKPHPSPPPFSSATQQPRPKPPTTTTSTSPTSSTSTSAPRHLRKSRRKRALPSSSPDIPTPPLDPADLDAIIQPRKHARDYALRQRAQPPLPPSSRSNPARSARTSNPTRDSSSDEDDSSASEVDSDHAPDRFSGIRLDPPGTRLGFMDSPDRPSGPPLEFGNSGGDDGRHEEEPRDYGLPLEIGELVGVRPITPPLPEYVDVPFAMEEEDVVMADQADEAGSEEALEDLLQPHTRSITPPSPTLRQPTPSARAPTPPRVTPPLPDPPALPLSQDRPKLSGVLVPVPENAPIPAPGSGPAPAPVPAPTSALAPALAPTPALAPALAPASKSMQFDLGAMLKKSRADGPPSPPPPPVVVEREVYPSDGLLEDEDAFLAALSGVIGMSN